MTVARDHLVSALDAVARQDKTAVKVALVEATRALRDGDHAARYHLRAAECVADISRWDDARDYLLRAVADLDESTTLPLAG